MSKGGGKDKGKDKGKGKGKGRVVWEFKTPKGHWKKYEDDKQKEIEDHYQDFKSRRGNKRFKFDVSGGGTSASMKISIQFSDMTQMLNPPHGKTSEVQRRET